ncbi:MAG: thioesterase family protein [bacterium]|nr:thioesterase family protein [bacterium]
MKKDPKPGAGRPQAGAPAVYRTRVRYAEVDRMGVAYHSRYIEWFEAARTEMLRSMGLPYRTLEESGFLLPVREVSCLYLAPARYDDVVEIRTEIGEVSRLIVELLYEAAEADTGRLLARGRTLHCFTNPSGRPVRAEPGVVALLTRPRKQPTESEPHAQTRTA